MKFSKIVKLIVESVINRDDLIDMGRGVCKNNDFLNCQLFAQLVSKSPNITQLPQISEKEMEAGDILVWGRYKDNPPRHYSIYIGDGEVMEVEEWGGDMRIIPLQQAKEEYEGMEIFRPNW